MRGMLAGLLVRTSKEMVKGQIVIDLSQGRKGLLGWEEKGERERIICGTHISVKERYQRERTEQVGTSLVWLDWG
jgi:hypothetical protein